MTTTTSFANEAASSPTTPIVHLDEVGKSYGNVQALRGVSLAVRQGEITCVLGDNGAGKSTLIKIIAGLHEHSDGVLSVNGETRRFKSPRESLDSGIATVYQDLALAPLMSVWRNFFLGNELTMSPFRVLDTPLTRRIFGPVGRVLRPVGNALRPVGRVLKPVGRVLKPVGSVLRKVFPATVFAALDSRTMKRIASEELTKMGIAIPNLEQPVGMLSGGQRQCVAIARAIYFGAKVLILDEPTAALGVKQSGVVLKYIVKARDAGLGVVFITHNPHHAYLVGNHFVILKLGRVTLDTHRADITLDQLTNEMAGGSELEALSHELRDIDAGAVVRPANASGRIQSPLEST